MRANVANLTLPAARRPAVAPAQAPQGAVLPPLAAPKFAKATLPIVGFVVYLWVLHSQKLPIAQPAIILGLVGILLQGGRLRLSAPLVWFAAFVAWGFVGALFSEYPEVALAAVWDYTKLWLIFLLAMNVAHSRAELRTVAIAWLAIYALYPIRGMLFNVVFNISEANRFAWNFIFENPNDMATLTLPIFGLTVALLQTERQKWFRFATIVGTFLLPVIIMLTQSRGGILALGVFGALLFFSNRRKGRAILMGAVAAGFIVVVAPNSVWNRLSGLRAATGTENLREVDAEGSADQRFEIWRVAMAIASDHPVLGAGLGTYKLMHANYAQDESRFKWTAWGRRDTHSTYFNVLAETGAVGLLLFFGMLGSLTLPILRKARTIRDTEPQAARQLAVLVFGLLAFLQACIFATMGQIAFLYIYAGVLSTAAALIPDGNMATSATRANRRFAPAAG